MLATETMARFGYDPTALSPGVKKVLLFRCAQCGETAQCQRRAFREGMRCRSCVSRAAILATCSDPQVLEKRRQSQQTAEYREKQRRAAVGKSHPWSPETRVKRENSWTPERRAARAQQTADMWSDPRKSEDIGRRISAAKKGQKPSAQTIVAIKKARAEYIITPEHRQKLVDACIARKSWEPMHRPEVKARVVELLKARTVAERSQSAAKSLARWPWTKEWLDRNGRLMRFRSSWELRLAKKLDELGLTWEFEAHRLLLPDGRVYIPDFWVVEWKTYLEVKGWEGWGCIDKVPIARSAGHSVVMLRTLKEIDAIDSAGPTPGPMTLSERED